MDKIIATTRIIIPNLEGKILLLKRASKVGFGLWNLPGGKVDPGELIIDASKKETIEETSLILDKIKPLFYSETPSGSDNRHYLTFYQLALGYSGSVILNHESSDYVWIDPITELNNFDVGFGNDSAIRRYKLQSH